MPAKAGIHNHRPVFMDSGLRRNDNERRAAIPLAGNVRQAAARADGGDEWINQPFTHCWDKSGMSEDRPQPIDPTVAAHLAQWRNAVDAPRPRGVWRGPAKYVLSALLLLTFVPFAVRFLVFSSLADVIGAHGVMLMIAVLPVAIIYGVFRILQ